jgi:hypothetical protein
MSTADTIYWREARPVIVRLVSALGATAALFGPISLILPAGISSSVSASPVVASLRAYPTGCTCATTLRKPDDGSVLRAR